MVYCSYICFYCSINVLYCFYYMLAFLPRFNVSVGLIILLIFLKKPFVVSYILLDKKWLFPFQFIMIQALSSSQHIY